MGNGEKNQIDVAGVARDNSVLSFPRINIDGKGWLVIHPFKDGVPNGDKYVGKTYLQNCKNKNVDIDVFRGLEQGEMFIVMLHRDLNEKKELGVIFIDDTNVTDPAVIKGNRMIGHAIGAL